MPFLSTPNAFLEQSSLLLEAYPEATRITTKYSYPSSHTPSNKITKPQAPNTTTPTTTKPATSDAPPAVATLTLKTYNPVTGICLKYRTNKAAEVGRLISGLGKLAAGVKISEDDGAGAGTGGAGDVEMTDVPAPAPAPAATVPAAATPPAGSGGKKKKGGKGKR
ncbi:signal recognition particle 9 kDa protein-domain-containing protein [Talaromyces proteolyticus]|uniref:Signal recognition particle 9 kDa protein-domain-containing protein n=1 Tax=Talaromyces proteolyticus TaxID=1131652 RepID=A0AAD4KQP8_9EURO|nr:signal recognition particle 9 kDa protein-domain-containing protein [Talaromyces proteolyticus]KAH8696197.1 signal recognition particle 9 kDa protein-domain-containing protein [Talaromyces proteolyticus]